ncbi:hypothetical protein [Bacillus paramycoides]|uniref:hypothetical protein n=1 Tax=Bacillus paramycoides TaxID=2026194 RepID=UPI002E241393|nr:hypothetical protein [Bacillus paramycoides]
MKKYGIRLFVIFTLILLGGCTIDKKNEEQQIINKATKTTIKYFKEKQDLDVVITGHEFGPKDLQSIYISGHVKDDKDKTFNIIIQYSGDEYTIGSISKSKSLKLQY